MSIKYTILFTPFIPLSTTYGGREIYVIIMQCKESDANP